MSTIDRSTRPAAALAVPLEAPAPMVPRWAALTGLSLLLLLLLAAVTGCEGIQRWADRHAAPVVVEDPEPTPEQLRQLTDAQAARAAGDYDQALDLFRSILAENPTVTPAYIGIGDIYMVQEDYAKAEPVYARAAQLEPRSYDAQYGHGLALQMLGRFIEAVRAYHRALTIDPDSPEANLNIATTYLQLERMQDALVFAEKAVELRPDDGAARVNLGAIYERLDRHGEAIDQYLAALELLEGDTTPVMMNLVNALAAENRYREAANTAENLVRIEPSVNAYERLGWAYFRLGEYDRSTEAYQAAVELDPTHWQSYNGIGVNALNAWLLSKKQDETAMRSARDAFRRSLRLNQDQPKLIALMSNYNLQ